MGKKGTTGGVKKQESKRLGSQPNFKFEKKIRGSLMSGRNEKKKQKEPGGAQAPDKRLDKRGGVLFVQVCILLGRKWERT